LGCTKNDAERSIVFVFEWSPLDLVHDFGIFQVTGSINLVTGVLERKKNGGGRTDVLLLFLQIVGHL
jgi:hypothetical protein